MHSCAFAMLLPSLTASFPSMRRATRMHAASALSHPSATPRRPWLCCPFHSSTARIQAYLNQPRARCPHAPTAFSSAHPPAAPRAGPRCAAPSTAQTLLHTSISKPATSLLPPHLNSNQQRPTCSSARRPSLCSPFHSRPSSKGMGQARCSSSLCTSLGRVGGVGRRRRGAGEVRADTRGDPAPLCGSLAIGQGLGAPESALATPQHPTQQPCLLASLAHEVARARILLGAARVVVGGGQQRRRLHGRAQHKEVGEVEVLHAVQREVGADVVVSKGTKR